MRKYICLSSLLLLQLICISQEKKENKTKIVAGLAGPELLHVGITQRLANTNQLGFSAGLGPSSGSLWAALSLQHRLYIGKNDSRTSQKTWFLRQGTTFFPQGSNGQKFTFNFTAGKDIPSKKNSANGITIDAGFFYLDNSESSSLMLIRSLNLWPALRFQLYFGI